MCLLQYVQTERSAEWAGTVLTACLIPSHPGISWDNYGTEGKGKSKKITIFEKKIFLSIFDFFDIFLPMR